MNRIKLSLHKAFVTLLGNEKRQSVTIPIFAILLSLITGAVLLALLGKNPFVAYYSLLQGSGILPKASYADHKGVLTDFFSLLNAWTRVQLPCGPDFLTLVFPARCWLPGSLLLFWWGTALYLRGWLNRRFY